MSRPAGERADLVEPMRLYCSSRRASLSRSEGAVCLSCHSVSPFSVGAGRDASLRSSLESLPRPRSAPHPLAGDASARVASVLPRVNVRGLVEDFSDIDPSKFHFYDFGIQDFLVMRQHITLKDEDNDESSSAGDYNQGLTIEPAAYLSDSEVSTGSVDLSAEQVVWEKRLVEGPAALFKNRLRHASYKKSNSSHEVRRSRRGGRVLRRRASDNLLGPSAPTVPLTRLLTDTSHRASRTDGTLPAEVDNLEIGEDCGSGSSLNSQTASNAALQPNIMPPVVTDWERPVHCSAAPEERCRRSYPCLTHALLLAGLPGGQAGRPHLSSACSAQRSRRPLPAAVAGLAAGEPVPTDTAVQQAAGDAASRAGPHGSGQSQSQVPESGRYQGPGSGRYQRYQESSGGRGPDSVGGQSRSRRPKAGGWSDSRSSSSDDEFSELPNSSASSASCASVTRRGIGDLMADVVDEPQMTALERKLIMKKHPMLRNDTNAHILAPPDFRIGMK